MYCWYEGNKSCDGGWPLWSNCGCCANSGCNCRECLGLRVAEKNRWQMLHGICLVVEWNVFSTNLASVSVQQCLNVNSDCSWDICSTVGVAEDGILLHILASSKDSKLSGVAMQGCWGSCTVCGLVSVMDWPSCYWASLPGGLVCQLNCTPVGPTSNSRPWKSHDAVMWKAILVNTTTYSHNANMEYTVEEDKWI
jgi:hypothetical protein